MDNPQRTVRRLRASAAIACLRCRRLKMRCIGAENPPCVRCAKSQIQCSLPQPSQDVESSDQRRQSRQEQDLEPTRSARRSLNPDLNNLQHQRYTRDMADIDDSPHADSHPTGSQPFGVEWNDSLDARVAALPSVTSAETSPESGLPSVYSIAPLVAVEFGDKGTPTSQQNRNHSTVSGRTTTQTPNDNMATHDAVSEQELLHLAILFRDKIVSYLPFVSNEDLADLPKVVRQRQDFAYCIAFVTSRFVPGCKQLRTALAQRVLSISRLAFGSVSDDPHEQWALLQCIAVLYAYASSSNADPDLGDILPAGELSHWSLKASIETLALRISLHRSAEHVSRLVANGENLSDRNIHFRRYMLWLWLFTISHYTALMTGTPPTIREDSTITSSPRLLSSCKDNPSVSRVLAEVELCLLWGQAGLQQRDLKEWWCLSSAGPNEVESTSKLALLQDIHSSLAQWSRRWGLVDAEGVSPPLTGPNRVLTSVDFHYRFTRFCISTYALRLLRYPAVHGPGEQQKQGALNPEAVTSLLESADAAMHFSTFLLELNPLAKERSRYIADFGFAMVAFACWFITKVSELPTNSQHPQPSVEKHLLSVKKVAHLLEELALDRKHSPSIYSSRILAAIEPASRQSRTDGVGRDALPHPTDQMPPPPTYAPNILSQSQRDYGQDISLYSPNTITDQDLLPFQSDADMFIYDPFFTF